MIEKYLSGGMCGYDREGSPIWYDVIGPVDPKGLFLSASKQDFIKSKIRDCEMLQKECILQTQRVNSRGQHSEEAINGQSDYSGPGNAQCLPRGSQRAGDAEQVALISLTVCW